MSWKREAGGCWRARRVLQEQHSEERGGLWEERTCWPAKQLEKLVQVKRVTVVESADWQMEFGLMGFDGTIATADGPGRVSGEPLRVAVTSTLGGMPAATRFPEVIWFWRAWA
jgi:hypothetical protein